MESRVSPNTYTSGGDVTAFAEDLGRRVLHSWRRHDFAKESFPAIAADELARRPVGLEINWRDLATWGASSENLPFQQYIDSTFGEPRQGRGERIVSILAESVRLSASVALRARVQSPDLRLFLGLLFSQRSWPDLRAQVLKLVPSVDPEDAVAGYVDQLGRSGVIPFVLDSGGRSALVAALTRRSTSAQDLPDNCQRELWTSRFESCSLLAPLFTAHVPEVA